MRKILLSIAGFDPTTGAGVSLDLKVFRDHGYYGMGILTSLTSQNTRSVKKVHCPPALFVAEQYRHLNADVEFSGIKVGMIGSADNIGVIGEILSDNSEIPVVIDPVFKSSGGSWLIEKRFIPQYMEKIREKASLLSPNLAEAGWISGTRVGDVKAMHTAAERIFDLTGIPCLVKGGHLPGRNIDLLFDGETFFSFENGKLKKSVHGTGCFLSSSILCQLVGGSPLDQAVSLAIMATRAAMKRAIKIGEGQLLFGNFR